MRLFSVLLLLRPCLMLGYQVQTPVQTPGSWRRRHFGEPTTKVNLPPAFVEGIVRTTECSSLWQATRVFFQTVQQESSNSNSRPISPSSLPAPSFRTSDYNFVENPVMAQKTFQSQDLPPFLKELSPDDCGIDASDHQAQLNFLQKNAKSLQEAQLKYGCIYFRGWSVFAGAESLISASKALGMTQCSDPNEALGPRKPLNSRKGRIYEASNHENDASIHVGMHAEAAPGFRPSTGLFACFQAAASGGEFLLADGHRILRDMDSATLHRIDSKGWNAVFADFPRWMSLPPGLLQGFPMHQRIHAEALSLVVDLTKPDEGYHIAKLPGRKDTHMSLVSGPFKAAIYHPVSKIPLWNCNIDAGHKGLFAKRNPHIKSRGSSFATTNFDIVHPDGSPLADRDVANVEAVTARNTIAVAMKPGDAIWLDNFRTHHGRKPFTGQRKHVVVWGK